MKQILFATALALSAALAGPVTAQVEPGEAIQDVITRQFDAFIAEDVDEAWTYASPGIQAMFGSPGRFGAMVEQGYPMVYAPSETRFLDLREMNGDLWQRVLVRDGAGTYHLLDYRMVELDGMWRIAGVQLIREAGVGA
ncbi:DUF4864 domain-containing protein [Maritimibacter sp. DP07]|jgi:hypothetical protein|uniref:DUF4864 domain-containing protein n=1 Tax=Maritimibacter harenae TaxID=2606218 RepID=A0A845M2B6_9RHOB|nr:DUF4864 domain-containing protein [Maritimibacter harenae]MZR14175.1 DUF4864 domain-containing protein [Maritimibacter harenae]